MYIVISYDISDDRRRARVCNELKNYAKRVQYSVFECDVNKNQLKTLKSKLGKEINKRKDSIRYYAICNACFEKMDCQGINKL